MALRSCPDCRHRMSTKAERCPNCGWSASRPTAEVVPVPFLLSAAEVRRRKVKCRECGEEIALGAGSCPHCGFAETGGRPARWKVALALVVLIALGVSVAVWQMGLFPKRDLSVSSLGTAVADSTTIEAQRRGVSFRRRRDPPRIRSSRF